MSKVNIIRVSSKLLARALDLPEDTSIKDVRVDFNTDCIEIKFESMFCFEKRENEPAPHITLRVLEKHKMWRR